MEWIAVLLVGVVVAAGISTALRSALPRAASVEPLFAALAGAAAAGGTAPVPPVIGGADLPDVDHGSIVAVARSAVASEIAELPPGSNRGPGIDAFTDGHAEAWCADFVSWVLRAAGRPFTGGASAGWRIAWTPDVRAWFVARAAYRDRLVARPQPGDVVWFIHGHVGIVERVDRDAITTIEGNAGDAVRRRTYPRWRLNPDIGGFGRVPGR
ncbi:MAG: CHAP domain-containing protein [Gaiellales bacterium]